MGFTYKGTNSDAVTARRGPPRQTPRASSGRPLPKGTRGDVTGEEERQLCGTRCFVGMRPPAFRSTAILRDTLWGEKQD